MKKLLAAILIVSSISGMAQSKNSSKNPVDLSKGQNITIVNSMDMQADLGMGMEMKNKTTATHLMTVLESNAKNYKVSNKVTKLALDVDMMGQQTTYDSEKESDRNTEMGKTISEQIGKSQNIWIDNITGKYTIEKTDQNIENEANPVEGMMDAMGGDQMGYVDGIFLVIPKNKKVGESWTDFDSTKANKTTSVYSLTSMNKDSAKIAFTSTKVTSTTFETQGMQMNIELETKSAGEITVDPKNGHVNRRTSNSDTTGTIEVMGQTTPITMKGTSITTVAY